MKHEFSLHSRYCSLKFLGEIRKLCEVNACYREKCLVYSDFKSLLLFSLKHEALLDNFKSNYFLDKGETIEVRFYKQIDGS